MTGHSEGRGWLGSEHHGAMMSLAHRFPAPERQRARALPEHQRSADSTEPPLRGSILTGAMRRPPPGHSRRRFLRGSLALGTLGLLSGCALPAPQAQPSLKIPRVGFLSITSPPSRPADGGGAASATLAGLPIRAFADGALDQGESHRSEIAQRGVDESVQPEEVA